MSNLSRLFLMLLCLSGVINIKGQADEPKLSLHKRLELGRGALNGGLAWEPDGRAFAISTTRGAWIYDTDFKDVAHLGDKPTYALTWSPDGSNLAIGGTD